MKMFLSRFLWLNFFFGQIGLFQIEMVDFANGAANVRALCQKVIEGGVDLSDRSFDANHDFLLVRKCRARQESNLLAVIKSAVPLKGNLLAPDLDTISASRSFFVLCWRALVQRPLISNACLGHVVRLIQGF